MDDTELAKKMLEWESLKEKLDSLEEEIKTEVLARGKTQVVGKCRVTYSGGRNTYDYETPAQNAPQEIIDKYKTEVINIDYKLVCKDAKIEPLVVSKSEPTATVKLETKEVSKQETSSFCDF
jgi:N-methylhydantoinase A/oxoprolinase/acetone carboxylase beta subunit